MEISEDSFFQRVKEISKQSREKTFRIANSAQLIIYWKIVEYKQEGKKLTKYREMFDGNTLRNTPPFLSVFFNI